MHHKTSSSKEELESYRITLLADLAKRGGCEESQINPITRASQQNIGQGGRSWGKLARSFPKSVARSSESVEPHFIPLCCEFKFCRDF